MAYNHMDWIIDIKASDHMRFCKVCLFCLSTNNSKSQSVHLQNGHTTIVTLVGSCTITHDRYLKNVLFVLTSAIT